MGEFERGALRRHEPPLFTFATPLEVEVTGTDLAAIEAVANRLVAAMTASPSYSDVESSIRPGLSGTAG